MTLFFWLTQQKSRSITNGRYKRIIGEYYLMQPNPLNDQTNLEAILDSFLGSAYDYLSISHAVINTDIDKSCENWNEMQDLKINIEKLCVKISALRGRYLL